MEVWGRSPQQGPGAEPLVSGSGGRSPPEASSILANMCRISTLLFRVFLYFYHVHMLFHTGMWPYWPPCVTGRGGGVTGLATVYDWRGYGRIGPLDPPVVGGKIALWAVPETDIVQYCACTSLSWSFTDAFYERYELTP